MRWMINPIIIFSIPALKPNMYFYGLVFTIAPAIWLVV